MTKLGKKFKQAKSIVDSSKKYSLNEAVDLVKNTKFTKFDESVDIAIRLGIDPKQSDQSVRSTVVLPHGTGKAVKVLVFAKGEKEKEASEAGADFVGGQDLVDKITKGWMEFDSVVSTPDMMGIVGKLGKILGPRGLMPNPKTGTVTFDLVKTIKEIKAGKVEFRTDKAGIVHSSIGRISFPSEKIVDNLNTFMERVIKVKPSSAKGAYIRSVSISSTMGPGVKIDPISIKILAK